MGVAQTAAVAAAATTTALATPTRNVLLSFDQLMSLGVLRSSSAQRLHTAPSLLVPTNLASTERNDQTQGGMAAIAILHSQATNEPIAEDGSHASQTVFAGPANQTGLPSDTSPSKEIQRGDHSDSDNSSNPGRDFSFIEAATRTRSSRMLPTSQSQRHRITSPPQVVTPNTTTTTTQQEANDSFYGKAQQKRQKPHPPAPEKRKRKEMKARKPPKRGLNRN